MVRKAAGRKIKNEGNGGDEIARVHLTHPDRVLYADQGITKRELALYYKAIADWILPHVENRPLTLLRCPEGYGKACFYQRHTPMLSTARFYTLLLTERIISNVP
jgi:bifunctional non-homologous end joining protein LigD